MTQLYSFYTITRIAYIGLIASLYFLILTHIIPETFIHIPLILGFIPISIDAFQKLRKRIIGTEFFLTIASVISYIGNQEKAIIVVLIIMLIAEFLEDLIENRTEKEIKSLLNLVPQMALILEDNQEKMVPIQKVSKGSSVIIATGGRIPVDGVIIKGSAAINESSLTGESVPVQKTLNDTVFAGTFIESGSIIVATEKIGTDTFFGKISALVQKAEEKKAKISILSDKIAFFLVPTLLILIGITWIITRNLNLVTTLLVFGSPLELTLITPLAILAGIIAAFKNGILVKGGHALEKLSQSHAIIFDKTGTITEGKPVITDITSYSSDYTQKDLLKIAAIAEKRSDHVIAKALLEKALEEHITIPDPDSYESLSGHGVKIRYNNIEYYLGNSHYIQAPEHGNIFIPEAVLNQYSVTTSSFYIGSEGKLLGMVSMSDSVRPEAKKTIEDLKINGFSTIALLSGDKQSITTAIAQKVGITVAKGNVFPDQKLLFIEELQHKKSFVTMVGDGINDAPALKQADVGIAMGAMGMEPAIEAADIVLISNDLYKVVFIHSLSKKVFRVVNQNIFLGFLLIHGMGILLTFLGFIDPLKAALFHAVSDIAILINSARLINFKLKK